MKKIITAISVFMMMLLSTVAAFAEDVEATVAPTATAAPTGISGFLANNQWVVIVIYVVLLGALFYFLIIRPQKKRQKEEQELKSSLCLGQTVTTIGGICGTIASIKDDEITVQTSIDNTLVTVKSWAIREVKKEVKE